MPAKVNSWTGGKDELQKRLQDYERLHSILQIICSSLRVEDILQQTIRETAKLCKADQAAILLFEP